jgi:hypothetical protein
MLDDFLRTNRDEIIRRARARVERRSWPAASATEVTEGVPLFLAQLSETLRRETTAAPFPPGEIRNGATRHARGLLARGFTVAQVVHDYGDIGHVITELALEQDAPIRSDEFQVLNRCLDTAIAEAVTDTRASRRRKPHARKRSGWDTPSTSFVTMSTPRFCRTTSFGTVRWARREAPGLCSGGASSRCAI